MTRALLVITDRRVEYLIPTMESAIANLKCEFDAKLMVDDSGDPIVAVYLDEKYPDFEIRHHSRPYGYNRCFADAFLWVRGKFDFVFLQENDWVYERPADVVGMEEVLRERSDLSEMVLVRCPANGIERQTGGFFKAKVAEDVFEPYETKGYRWLKRLNFGFSGNPALFPIRVFDVDFPPMVRDLRDAEVGFGRELLARGMTLGYWGTKADLPCVKHIGEYRVDFN